MIGGLAHGMTVLCYEGALDTPSQARFYEIVRTARRHQDAGRADAGCGCCAAPATRWRRHIRMPQLRLVSLQGEPLDPETFEWAARTLAPSVPVINAYGQSETGSTWTYPVAGVDDQGRVAADAPCPGHALRDRR